MDPRLRIKIEDQYDENGAVLAPKVTITDPDGKRIPLVTKMTLTFLPGKVCAVTMDVIAKVDGDYTVPFETKTPGEL